MPLVIEPLEQTSAPLLLVYGAAGLGKTSLALDAPNPIYIPIKPEAPPRNLRPQTVKGVVTFTDVIDALRMIYKDPKDYATVVIDSLTALEPLVWDETCIRKRWNNIETVGYGKGYLAADDDWRKLIQACDMLRHNRDMLIFLLCHSKTTRVDEPGLPPFNKFGLRLQDRAENLLTQAADATLFIYNKATITPVDAGFNKKILHAESGGLRWLACDGRAHFIAKNRLGLPEEIMLDAEHPFSGLAPYTTPDIAPSDSGETPPAVVEVGGGTTPPNGKTPASAALKPSLTIPADPPFVESTLPKTTEETSKEVLDGDGFDPIEEKIEAVAKMEKDNAKTN